MMTTIYTQINIENPINITNTPNQSTLNVGDTATFTITITNNGTDPVTNIKINDPQPNGFTAGNQPLWEPTITEYGIYPP